MEKLVLIDGNSLINRAFYAMPLLTTKNGEYTNAVYGFMNMFFKMLAEVKPTHVAVAFDVHAPTFRHNMYNEYKGTRKPMPEELRPQIPLLKEVLRLMNVAVIEQAGIEADDIIGTIAKSTSVPTYIYTGDRDSFQLVDSETTVYFTKRGITDIDEFNINNFTEKTGIAPIQIIDLKALMGDASDNIPGVKGVGEKTAISLIKEYGSLESVYENIENITGKLKEKLVVDKELAFLSKTLATINVNCNVCVDLDKMVVSKTFSSAVRAKFTELEFKSLYKRNDIFSNDTVLEQPINAPSTPIVEQNVTDSSLKNTMQENQTIDVASVKKQTTPTVVNVTELGEIATSINADCKELSLVITNAGLSIYTPDTNIEYVIKVRQTLLDDGFSFLEAINSVSHIFNGNATLIVYDKKGLRHFISKNANQTLTCSCEDVAIIKYLVDFSGADSGVLDFVAEYGLSNQTLAHSIYVLYKDLSAKLNEYGINALYRDIELPLCDILYEMENSGFKIDIDNLIATGKKYAEILAEKEAVIRTLTDEPSLNVNSPKQLGEVLFEKLKIGKGKKTKNGYSTAADVLENLEEAHPVISHIIEYRRIQKLQSTYIEGFKPLIDKATGLIHTSFNQTVTATGRLSSKEPNLQNIPVRDDEGRELRKLFAPKSANRVLISADYSQIELRLLAAFSGCKGLVEAFNNGQDVHSETASKVFKVSLENVTSAMRRNAKAVNFGIIYGISEYGLAKNVKTTPAQAREYIAEYFKQYPEVKEYMDSNVAFAKENGYVKTLFGRRRYIRELSASNYMLRQFGERVAMNMPLQGSAADIIKLAMIGVFNRLKKENLKSELILQVHDELIIDAFEDEKEVVKKLLKEEMERAVSLSVKLEVSMGEGKTWFEAK